MKVSLGMIDPAVVQLLSFVFQVTITIIGVVIWLTKMETRITKAIQDAKDETEQKISGTREDALAKLEMVERGAGEVASALRAKIHEVELYIRDNFVSKASFTLVLEGVKTDFTRYHTEIKAGLDNIQSRMIRTEKNGHS